MSIWAYTEYSRCRVRSLVECRDCPFCKAELSLLHDRFRFEGHGEPGNRRGFRTHRKVKTCLSCGWWSIDDQVDEVCDIPFVPLVGPYYEGAAGAIKLLDLLDLSTPIDEVRAFLLAKQESRFELHPRLFEETVASVFKDLGFSVAVTTYSNDGGLDVILENSGCEVGVQVKRYKDKIGVAQIRELIGALVSRGTTAGIFLTTSNFTRGCQAAQGVFAARGYPVELIDGDRFLEALGIAQRPVYASYEELTATIGKPPMTTLGGNFKAIV